MPAKNTKKGSVPTLCTRKSAATGKPIAYATFGGKFVSFGPAGPDAKQRFDEFLAKWLANGRRLDDDVAGEREVYRVEDLVADFLEHARTYYVTPAGKTGGEFVNLRLALAPVLELFRELPAAEFGPVALRAVREKMVAGGRLCRKEINNRVHRIKRAWRWAASNEEVSGSLVESLNTLDGLRAGKTTARESEPVRPVAESTVHEVVAHLCPTTAAMVWFAYWTGARPGEVCRLRWSFIDRTGKVWIATPPEHKTAWRGKVRRIAIGPEGQKVLMPFLRPGPDAPVFSPQRAVEEQRAKKAATRRSKVPPSQVARAAAASAPADLVGECYDVAAFRKAIARGVRAANAARIRQQVLATVETLNGGSLPVKLRERIMHLSVCALTDDRGGLRLRERSLLPMLGADTLKEVVDACGQVPLLEKWAPNMLRHTAATRLRREEGIEAARVVLGHSSAVVTEIYAEADHARSLEIMERLG